jgi:replicative DNA helicase
MDLVFFEQVIIKFLFTRDGIKDRVINYITPEIFDDICHVNIIKKIKAMYIEFSRIPTVSELKLQFEKQEHYDSLMKAINVDISQYSDDYLFKECEKFIRTKLATNYCIECVQTINDDKMEKAPTYPDKIREALAFSFDTAVGIDYIEDGEKLYDYLHCPDSVIPTGIRWLDRLIGGGVHSKSITLFMSETNMGKTLIMTSLCTNMLFLNKNILYLTCEESADRISNRITANIFDHCINDLADIDKPTFLHRFNEIKNRVKSKLIVKEYPPKRINCNDIRNLIKEIEIKKKIIPNIAFFDYIELINPTFMLKSDNSNSICTRVTEEARAIGVEYNIPIVSADQSNRDGYGTSEMQLKHSGSSIGIQQTADISIGVTQPPEFIDANRYSWKIMKSRFGGKNKKGVVGMDVTRMRVFDVNSGVEDDFSDETNNRPKQPTDQSTTAAVSMINDSIKKNEGLNNQSIMEWD